MGKVKCTKCGIIIESKYRHDYQVCGCDNSTMVDGGNDYLRVGGVESKYVTIWNEETQDFISSGDLEKLDN